MQEIAKMVKDYKSYSSRTFPEFNQILWTVTGPLFHLGQNSGYTSTVDETNMSSDDQGLISTVPSSVTSNHVTFESFVQY